MCIPILTLSPSGQVVFLPDGGDGAAPPPSPEKLLKIVETSPPLMGLEYLGSAVLENLWTALVNRTRDEAGRAGESVQDYLKNRNSLWNMVGRVVFHLAENRKNEARPFGFLVTYTTRLSGLAKPQFLPLGRAFREFADTADRRGLLALLTPLQRAADASTLIRGLVDSGEIFHPLAWTVRETCRFLDDVPGFESSGVLVRIPEAWQGRGRPPRPQVSVKIGAKKPGGLGLDAILDFSVGLTLDGEELTQEERRRILGETSGLILLRGKWVEIDTEKIAALLSFWEKRKGEEGNGGISFSEGMRLLAGAGMEGGEALPAAEAVREWLNADAGEWLRSILAGIRSPEGIVPADPGGALKTTLRPYQRTGVAWLRFMRDLGLGSCIADDMGLGKTIQVLALLLILRQRKVSGASPPSGPALLVVPASLVANWKAEIARFAPSLATFYVHPSETPAATLAIMTDGKRRAAAPSELLKRKRGRPRLTPKTGSADQAAPLPEEPERKRPKLRPAFLRALREEAARKRREAEEAIRPRKKTVSGRGSEGKDAAPDPAPAALPTRRRGRPPGKREA